MGMHEDRARLWKSTKDLLSRWSETRSHWDDASSHSFEEKYMVPLEQEAKKAVSAMDSMAQVLQLVKRDCE